MCKIHTCRASEGEVAADAVATAEEQSVAGGGGGTGGQRRRRLR